MDAILPGLDQCSRASLCWCVADAYASELRSLRAFHPKSHPSASPPSSVILSGLRDLAIFLLSQAEILEDVSAEEKKRKAIYDRVPHEVVRDPSGLARELLWRVRRQLGEDANESSSAVALPDCGALAKGASKSKKKEIAMFTAPSSRTWKFEPPWVFWVTR